MIIPVGATHYLLASPLDFNQQPDFMRWTYERWHSIDDRPVYAWYAWHQGYWVRDSGFFDRYGRLQDLTPNHHEFGLILTYKQTS